MLKTVLLLSLISGLDGFTQPSLDLNQTFYRQVDNTNLPNTSKQIIAQRKAPRNTPQNTPTQKTYPTVEVDGFLFQFKGCKSTEPRVTRCDFLVKNITRDRRRLSIGLNGITRIIDDLGNELNGSDITLGARRSVGWEYNEIPANTSVKANIIFRGDIGDNIVLLDIRANDSQVEFRQK